MKKIITFLNLILLFSCSDKLSNSKAEKLISEYFELPKKEIWKIDYKINHVLWNSEFKRFKPLVREGLLISRKVGKGMFFHYLHTKPTNKGNKYVVKKNEREFYVELCTLEFGKIISIHEIPQTNEANVKFTLIRTNFTPFGVAYRTWLDNEPLEKTIIKTVTLHKLNDGWSVADFEKKLKYIHR